MKKVILSALVVVAAIGGTLVSNASSRFTSIPAGTLNSLAPCNQTVDDNICNPTPTGTPCKLITGGPDVFTTEPSTGNCERPLYRQ